MKTDQQSAEAAPRLPLLTALVSPAGAVHMLGQWLTDHGDDQADTSTSTVLEVARNEAAKTGRPVRVAIARPDGTVDSLVVDPAGHSEPVNAHPQPHPTSNPQWQGIPERQFTLLATVRAADRIGNWRAAQLAAERLTLTVTASVGTEHPWTVLATELHGYFALRAGDQSAGSRLSVASAIGRYELGSPQADTAECLMRAVKSWLQSDTSPDRIAVGCALGHLLAKATPKASGPISLVLGALDIPSHGRS